MEKTSTIQIQLSLFKCEEVLYQMLNLIVKLTQEHLLRECGW
jgi:hypothetical protein